MPHERITRQLRQSKNDDPDRWLWLTEMSKFVPESLREEFEALVCKVAAACYLSGTSGPRCDSPFWFEVQEVTKDFVTALERKDKC